MRFLFVFFLFSISRFSFSNTTITGTAPEFKNKTLFVRTYSDLITYNLIAVASDTIDDSGNFSFTVNNTQPLPIFINIDDYESQFYIESNKNYIILYEPIPDAEITPFWKKKSGKITIQNTDSSDLNQNLSQFYESYDNFMLKNYTLFLSKRAKPSIDSFNIQVNETFKSYHNFYFQNTTTYTTATMYLANNESKKKIYEKYIDSKPVLYHHVTYMDFINQFYNQFFNSISFKNRTDLINSIKTEKSFSDCLKILAREPFLKNERIRELVLLIGLYDMYNNPQYSKQNTLFIIKEIAIKSEQKEHQEIAKNMVFNLTKMTTGHPAPDFHLPNQKRDVISLDSILKKKKYVYLNFWATWCTSCIKEMELIHKLKNQYNDFIEFVSISLDKETTKPNSYLKENQQYNWTFLDGQNSFSLIDDYNIKAVPTYFLIDSDGILLESPALKPSENIESVFKKIQPKSTDPKFILREK